MASKVVRFFFVTIVADIFQYYTFINSYVIIYHIYYIPREAEQQKKRKVLEIKCVCFEHYVFEREEKKTEKAREAGRISFTSYFPL